MAITKKTVHLITRVAQLGLQRCRWRRLMILSASLFTLAGLGIWRTGHFYLLYYLLPEDRGWLPKIDKQMETQCEPLLRTAGRILDGEEIPFPYGGKKTLWPFKERVPQSQLLNNLDNQDGREDSEETLKKFKQYNVSARDINVRKLFITFGHNCCLYAKRRALNKARTVGGFDYVHSFNMDSLTLKFRQTHFNILRSRRGAGYWLWKPYILLQTLIENMVDGDLVMYQDAGAYLIRSAAPLLKLCLESKHGIIIFSLADKIENSYTKKDASVLMDMNISEAGQSMQRLASFIVIKKSCTSIQFVMEWLAYLSDRRIASDDANTMGIPNAKLFKNHRHDQSVMSLLSKKWGIPAFRDPSQWGIEDMGKYYSSGPYEQLINHDRFKG